MRVRRRCSDMKGTTGWAIAAILAQRDDIHCLAAGTLRGTFRPGPPRAARHGNDYMMQPLKAFECDVTSPQPGSPQPHMRTPTTLPASS